MSTVLNHAISIPASPKRVWEQIRQIDKNPLWQVNSERVAFLTSKQHGRGTRWRNYDDGNEQVIEITAWYEGLGYEYVIVDGAPFSSNRGRIRLQETPDGTVIQWTFSYEMSGMLGGLRNALGTRQRLDGDIIDSLRNIHRYIKETKHTNYMPQESKALMKAAPSAKERSSYQPRHPSVLKNSKTATSATDPDAIFRPPAQATPTAEDLSTVQPAAQQQGISIVEPPIEDDDTRPNPSVQDSDELTSASAPEAPAVNVSSVETAAAPTPPTTSEDETSSTQATYRPDEQATVPSPTTAAADADQTPAAPKPEPTTPAASLSDADSVERPVEEPASTVSEITTPSATQETTTAEPTEPATAPEPMPTQSASTAEPEPIEMPDTSNIDTAQVSVFDLFGVPRPSGAEKPNLGSLATEAAEAEVETESAISSEPTTSPTAQAAAPEVTTNTEDVTTPPEENALVESTSQAIVPAETYKPAADSPFADQTPIVPDVTPEPRNGRTGLRAKLRRQLTRLRRP